MANIPSRVLWTRIFMPSDAPHLDRFIRALRRRLTLVKILERAGLCLALSCAVALVALPILLFRADPTTPRAALTILCAGALTGILWGALRRPTSFDAALEADRQLRLSDLLATALTLPKSEPWSAAVLAHADRRCRALSPGSVVANRFGARAWGGIGLATALVVTVALIPTTPRTTTAAANSDDDAGTVRSNTSSPTRSEKPPRIPSTPHTPQEAITESGPHTLGAIDDNASTNSSDRSLNRSAAQSHASPDGAGSGAGRTPDTNNAAPPFKPRATASAQDPTAAEAGSGGGTSDDALSPGDDAAATGRVAGGAPRPAPPWASDAWPADRRSAIESLESGKIPAQYRDIVREYFDIP